MLILAHVKELLQQSVDKLKQVCPELSVGVYSAGLKRRDTQHAVSSKPNDLDRLLDGQPIHLCNTDPPYNVKVEPRSNNAIAAGLSSFQGTTHHQSMDVARHPEKSKPTQKKLRAKDRPLANDFVSDDEFDRLLDAWFGNIARVLVPGRGFYIWGGYANCANYPPFLKKHGLYFSQALIWDKQHPVLTRKDRMGSRVERVGFAWERGKVVGR